MGNYRIIAVSKCKTKPPAHGQTLWKRATYHQPMQTFGFNVGNIQGIFINYKRTYSLQNQKYKKCWRNEGYRLPVRALCSCQLRAGTLRTVILRVPVAATFPVGCAEVFLQGIRSIRTFLTGSNLTAYTNGLVQV